MATQIKVQWKDKVALREVSIVREMFRMWENKTSGKHVGRDGSCRLFPRAAVRSK